jgi:hypothetical protein
LLQSEGGARRGAAPVSTAPTPTPTGPPPEDEDAAIVAIEAAFRNMDARTEGGTAVPAVEGGANLGAVLDEAASRARARGYPSGQVTRHVERIVFLNPTEAAVRYRIEMGENTYVPGWMGRAVCVEGKWKVSRDTFAHEVATLGISCPPPP